MKNLIAFLLLFFLLTNVAIAQVSINTDGAAPDNSAMLDVKSDSKGFLPPRVALTASNVAEPVASPASGLLIYNTATAGTAPNDVQPGYYYWNGSQWSSLLMPAGTTGQTLRNDGGNWIANDVLYNNGLNVGIGYPWPTHKLTIAGGDRTLRLIGEGTNESAAKLNFGDGDYVHLTEDIDDNLLIHATGGTAITGGNVGIGLGNPTHKLTIAGSTQTLRLIGPGLLYGESAKLNFGDGDLVLLTEDIDDNLLIYASGRTAIMGGNVGIGTTTPDNRLTVAGTIQTTTGGFKFPDNTIQTTAAVTVPPNNIHYVGENYGGGKVFFVYDGGQHGLIAATADQSTGILWYNGTEILTGTRDGVRAGLYNTERIIIKKWDDGVTWDLAASACANYSGGIYGDWYLPSKYELDLLYQQKDAVGGFSESSYWSSTQFNGSYAWSQYFGNGFQGYDTTWNHWFCVRAIRAF